MLVKLPGPGPDDERIEVGRRRIPRPRAESSTSPSSARAMPVALAEHAAVQDEGARRDVGRGVEGENEHQCDAL